MTVVPLARKPAYTPMPPRGLCSTPGHKDQPAWLYPCGWRCEACRPVPFEGRRKNISSKEQQ